jgi:hypothetical protein
MTRRVSSFSCRGRDVYRRGQDRHLSSRRPAPYLAQLGRASGNGRALASLAPTPALSSVSSESYDSRVRLRGVVSAVAVGATSSVLAVSAWAVATPVSPAPGSTVTTAHPLFEWSLPANEQSEGIYLANNASTTPEGRFFDEHLVDWEPSLNESDRQWSPSSPLYAGSYWWSVQSSDRESSTSFYSPPSVFTIPISLHIVSLRIIQYQYFREAELLVRWVGNVKRSAVQARAFWGRRVVWSGETTGYGLIGDVSTEVFWPRTRRVPRGTRLLLRVTVNSGKTTVRRSVRFLAP